MVSANNSNYELTLVHFGVPQSSVLGPLRFLSYLDDLPACVSSDIQLFVRDFTVHRQITCDNDISAL